MKTRRILVSIDFYVQAFLFGIAVISGLIALVTFKFDLPVLLFSAVLFLLGVWQIMSALISGISLSDSKKTQYLIISLCYAALVMFLFVTAKSGGGRGVSKPVGIIFGAFIPMCFALFYLRLTKRLLKQVKGLEGNQRTPTQLDNILDSEEIFKPIEK